MKYKIKHIGIPDEHGICENFLAGAEIELEPIEEEKCPAEDGSGEYTCHKETKECCDTREDGDDVWNRFLRGEPDEPKETKKFEASSQDIKNINKRLGDFEDKVGRASKSDVNALAEYVKRKTEGLVSVDEVLEVLDVSCQEWLVDAHESGFFKHLRNAIEQMKRSGQ